MMDNWVLDAGYWMLDTGSWILDAGHWELGLVVGYWILGAGYWITCVLDKRVSDTLNPTRPFRNFRYSIQVSAHFQIFKLTHFQIPLSSGYG